MDCNVNGECCKNPATAICYIQCVQYLDHHSVVCQHTGDNQNAAVGDDATHHHRTTFSVMRFASQPVYNQESVTSGSTTHIVNEKLCKKCNQQMRGG